VTNVRGLFKSEENVHDLIILQDPDIIALIESKIKGGVKIPEWLQSITQPTQVPCNADTHGRLLTI